MDIAKIREDFPITRGEILYFNNAAVSGCPTPVVTAATKGYEEQSHRGMFAFWDGLEVVDEARAQCARLINAETDEIALVENTGTGINIVANMLDWAEGDNIIINDLEYFPYQWLRLRKHGIEVRIISSEKPDGTRDVTIDDLRAASDERTKVICVSAVSYINGLRHDLEAVGALAKERGAYLVVDAVQAVGALQIDVRKGPVDFLSCGGHKWLLSPMGTGFFYCRRELTERFEPAYIGWLSDRNLYGAGYGTQPEVFGCESGDEPDNLEYDLSPTARRFMTGTYNLGGAYGLHAGTKYLLDIGVEEIEKRNMALTDRLVEGIRGLGLRFLSPLRREARSQIVTFVPTNLEKTLRGLADARIPLPPRRIGKDAGIRVSPNFYNEAWEIDRLLEVMAEIERS